MSPPGLAHGRARFATFLAVPSHFFAPQNTPKKSGLEQSQHGGQQRGKQGFDNHAENQPEFSPKLDRTLSISQQQEEAEDFRNQQKSDYDAEEQQSFMGDRKGPARE